MTPVLSLALVHARDLTPDEARSEMRRELLRPEYRERDLTERALQWFLGQLDQVLNAASGVPPLSYLAALVVGFVLVLVLGLALSRLGHRSHERSASPTPLLEEGVSAEQLRIRARTALAEGRHKDAVVDAFRALATSQVEQRRVENVPGATAHELAEALAEAFGDHRSEIVAAADLFDATLYGDQDVRPEQAVALLALETDLAGAR
ncbi:DUF4129 domain-containing protein [Nocardioides gilvus]|uniref:DUF4129 domain-containing protein n=1 Tax=Nocardioides gilvus TaxID=1735589 RepID=UPI000D74C70B|nr:DUF4129 domain-containing protein [Nocardioides gilvus]